MEAEEMAHEAHRWMARINEIGADPDDVVMILSIVMGQFLVEHSRDTRHAGQALIELTFRASSYYLERPRLGSLH